MKVENLRIGQYVYHRDVYDHKERLKIVGIRENEVELEGDYSGGTNNVCQRDWLPLKGLSTVYNHAYKQQCRDYAVSVEALAVPITDRNQDSMTKTMFDLHHMVMVLTTDVSLNHEF